MCGTFFWSRDLFISQDHGLYIEHVNHDLTVMIGNLSTDDGDAMDDA